MAKLQIAGVALSVLLAAALAGCNKPAAAPEAAPAADAAAAPAAAPAADAAAAPASAAPAADAGGDQGNPHPQ